MSLTDFEESYGAGIDWVGIMQGRREQADQLSTSLVRILKSAKSQPDSSVWVGEFRNLVGSIEDDFSTVEGMVPLGPWYYPDLVATIYALKDLPGSGKLEALYIVASAKTTSFSGGHPDETSSTHPIGVGARAYEELVCLRAQIRAMPDSDTIKKEIISFMLNPGARWDNSPGYGVPSYLAAYFGAPAPK